MACIMHHEDPAVSRFREYLRIPTVSSSTSGLTEAHEAAYQFLAAQAQRLGLPCKVLPMKKKGYCMIVITWEGSDPALKSLILYSHIDVVPAEADNWIVDPFSAHKNENGDIIARGAQDMKCCGMQYLEAIERLKSKGEVFPRTVHVLFGPDEELGGEDGMNQFVKSEHFESLNAGYYLDEGLANTTESFTVYYGEKSQLSVDVKCEGNPGHGSRFIEETAGEKMGVVIQRALDFRQSQKRKLEADQTLRLGDVTSLNLTRLGGEYQHNVIPSEFHASFDIRVTPADSKDEVKSTVQSWLNDAGKDCTMSVTYDMPVVPMTSTDPSNPWWKAFSSACEKHNMMLEQEIFPAGTDGHHMKLAGIPGLGFSPINNTPILLHDHNEFLNENVFLKGISIYQDIIASLASVPSH